MTEKTNRQMVEEEDNNDLFTEDADTDNEELNFADPDEGETKDDELLTDETKSEAEAPAKPANDKVKIKYMGTEEEIDLSDREALVTLLQKGKNYDSKLEELETLKNSEELAFVRNMAKEAGVKDTKAFMETVQKDLRNQRIQTRASKLMEEGMSEDHAMYTADLELKATEAKPQAEEVEEKPDASGFTELLTDYPETAQFKTLADFPDSVREAIQTGKNPVNAYQTYLIAKAKAEIEQVKNTESAKERDLGSMRSAKNDVKTNPFLEGLDS